MENKTKLTIGAIISLALAMTGTYYVADTDEAYYCESRDLVMLCEKLSSGIGTRCYFEETYKTCKEGWEKIELSQELTPEIISSDSGTKWECSPTECTKLQ